MLRRKEFNPSTVVLTHIPTGIVGVGDTATSQHRNKAKALSMLRSRVWASLNLDPDSRLPVASYVLPENVQYPEDLQQFRKKSPALR